MRIIFMRMINKTQDVMPRNIINLSDILVIGSDHL